MTLRALFIAYVVGGLTFLPLLVLSILAVLWYTLPITTEHHSTTSDAETKAKESSLAAQTNKSSTDGAASGTFAVLRRYDFQGALTSFKEANNLANQAEVHGDGKTTESISVYQSMYRSVFDRTKTVVNPMQEGEAAQQNGDARAQARGKVFYIVLRHGHLMLYDSQIQLEVRHVISLAHYKVSLEDDIITEPADFLDGELFAKRTAIVLTALPDKQHGGVASLSSKKPFYLFCDINTEKEDFYHAMLSSMVNPPIPKGIETESAIKLQSAVHSSSLSTDNRALNALLGRIFLSTHRTPILEAFVRSKIEKKMARIQKPAFIASIACHSLELGDAAPIISNLKLKELNISGEMLLSLDFKYNGGANITLSATAKLDLGQRFKTRMVSLLLAVVLQRVQGKMLIRIKPPPSNRIWVCFESMPDLELKIEPIVSSRQITYAFVLRAIEARIREAFAEGMVKPNWDDTPFFATTAQLWRGGIWESEGQQEVQKEDLQDSVSAESNPLSERNGKTMSTPTLGTALDNNDTGVQTSSKPDIPQLGNLKHRSMTGLSSLNGKATEANAQSAADKAWTQSSPGARAPKFVRSPSVTSPKPLVALDDISADAIRSDDASIPPARRRWIGRGGQAQTQKRDAAEVVRQVRDRDSLGRKDGILQEVDDDQDGSGVDALSELDSPRRASEPGVDEKPKRSMTGFGSLPATHLTGQKDTDSIHSRSGSVESGSSQRKTILATTAAATNAARQWTWNAVANRANRQQLLNKADPQRQYTKGSNESDSSSAQGKDSSISTPIGRGQPLPPIGVPLPGPAQKGLWNAAAAGLGNLRKKQPPKLPARPSLAPTTADRVAKLPIAGSEDVVLDKAELEPDHNGEGDFGPWMANHDEAETPETDEGEHDKDILTADDLTHPIEEHTAPATGQSKKKTAPPLPPRRRAAVDNSSRAEFSADKKVNASLNEPTTIAESEQPATTYKHQIQVSEPKDIDTESLLDHFQSPTPPGLIDPDDEPHHNTYDAHDANLDDELDSDELHDHIQAIPAPVDAEAEKTGVLDMAEPQEQEQQDMAGHPDSYTPTKRYENDTRIEDDLDFVGATPIIRVMSPSAAEEAM